MSPMSTVAPFRLATPTALTPSVYEGHVALNQVGQPAGGYSNLASAHTLAPATSSFLLPPSPKASRAEAQPLHLPAQIAPLRSCCMKVFVGSWCHYDASSRQLSGLVVSLNAGCLLRSRTSCRNTYGLPAPSAMPQLALRVACAAQLPLLACKID